MNEDKAKELLSTCPESLVDRYKAMADRAASGSRASAMKLKCLECCAWSIQEVNRCEIKGCSLWGFRSAAQKEKPESEKRRGTDLQNRARFTKGVHPGARTDRPEQAGVGEQEGVNVPVRGDY